MTPPPAPQSAYGIFVDDINQANASRIAGAVSVATQQGVKEFHVLFQSWGGFVGDGVMLYNLFRSLTCIDLVLYNAGQVASAAVMAYLGAARRVASSRSLFMLHKAHSSPQGATAAKMERVAESLALDDERAESIWREHLKLPDEMWTELQFHDVYLTGEDALKFGLATEVGEFAPPKGSVIYKL